MKKIQTRCGRLSDEVDRLSAERDKLMEIGNGLRAELNRALSNSFEVSFFHSDRLLISAIAQTSVDPPQC